MARWIGGQIYDTFVINLLWRNSSGHIGWTSWWFIILVQVNWSLSLAMHPWCLWPVSGPRVSLIKWTGEAFCMDLSLMACLSLIAGLSLVATFQHGGSQITNIQKPSISRHQYQNIMHALAFRKSCFWSYNPKWNKYWFQKSQTKINTIDRGGWVKEYLHKFYKKQLNIASACCWPRFRSPWRPSWQLDVQSASIITHYY